MERNTKMNVGLNARGCLLGVRANVLVKVSTNESLSKITHGTS